MKRKEKKEEYTGLFHNADDYGIYHMTAQQRILGFVVGMFAGAVVFQIFFGLWIFSIIAAAGCGIVGILAYKNILHKKRNALLLLEFRDMLEAISTSLGSGKNTTQAFSDARSDMKNQYGEQTDIVKELEKPARDPRDEMPKPILRTDVLDIKDLKEGMILKGTVRNVIDFGAFVDIGVHQDGLVHISQMSEKFIKHPLEAVSVGDVVEVRVLGVDEKKNRISLSMKGLNK